MKQQIKVKLERGSLWDLEDPIDKVIEYFQKIQESYATDNYDKILVEPSDDYPSDTSFTIYGVRLETDEEEQKREKINEEHQQRVRENKRIQYEKLKKEFEG